jgi:alkylhydroperoxidase family enzyme
VSTDPRVALIDYAGGVAGTDNFLGHYPQLLRAFDDLYATVWNDGEVDHATKEVARMRNARKTECGYCSQVRFSVARAEGLSEDVVSLISDEFDETELDPRYKDIIRWVDAYLLDPSKVDPRVRADVKAHLGAGGEVELACALAIFRAFGKTLITLGLEPKPGAMPVAIYATPGSA